MSVNVIVFCVNAHMSVCIRARLRTRAGVNLRDCAGACACASSSARLCFSLLSYRSSGCSRPHKPPKASLYANVVVVHCSVSATSATVQDTRIIRNGPRKPFFTPAGGYLCGIRSSVILHVGCYHYSNVLRNEAQNGANLPFPDSCLT